MNALAIHGQDVLRRVRRYWWFGAVHDLGSKTQVVGLPRLQPRKPGYKGSGLDWVTLVVSVFLLVITAYRVLRDFGKPGS